MKKILYTIFLITLSVIVFAQEKSFKIKFPENWIAFQRQNVVKSVNEKYELSDSLKKELMANNNGSVQLYGYTAPNRSGLLYRPNTQVLLRQNKTQNINQFKILIERSLEGFKGSIHDIKILTPLAITTVGGKQAVSVKISGYLATKDNQKAYFNSSIYAIPEGDAFYQITMNDTDDYNCEDQFKEVLASIEF
ncbi:hypothetical protein EOD41_09485 [Mucilaginibacter limnophilus]|uniref:Uncharacterized protein n=1 Tax=Mucilaginibacter limnophilus TaxID=1932778 RepID=A0A3S3TH24_9SPHI|nr:hypothetical protein [Mucilaginibacter limnophilus]RVU00859.1 hypothetical protein EOD41_09485 [Mucilaginibacter limnophilus]